MDHLLSKEKQGRRKLLTFINPRSTPALLLSPVRFIYI